MTPEERTERLWKTYIGLGVLTWIAILVGGIHESVACYREHSVACWFPAAWAVVPGLMLGVFWPLAWLIGLSVLLARCLA